MSRVRIRRKKNEGGKKVGNVPSSPCDEEEVDATGGGSGIVNEKLATT